MPEGKNREDERFLIRKKQRRKEEYYAAFIYL